MFFHVFPIHPFSLVGTFTIYEEVYKLEKDLDAFILPSNFFFFFRRIVIAVWLIMMVNWWLINWLLTCITFTVAALGLMFGGQHVVMIPLESTGWGGPRGLPPDSRRFHSAWGCRVSTRPYNKHRAAVDPLYCMNMSVNLWICSCCLYIIFNNYNKQLNWISQTLYRS